jgi:hypothetical protein
MSYLEDALLVSGERRQYWIVAASDEFRKASTIESPLMAAKAMFFVGVCYNLLGERPLALKWYEQAYEKALSIENALLDKSKKTLLDNVALISLPLTSIYGAAWLGYRRHQKNKARQALNDLREFLIPLSTLLISYQSNLKTLQTVEQRENNYHYLFSSLNGAPPPPLKTFPPAHSPVPHPGEPGAWAYLIFTQGKQVYLRKQRMLIGRVKHEPNASNPDIDLTPLPESSSVSHLHAALENSSGTIIVTDLKSRNGTFHNGRRLEPLQNVSIKDGDILIFGKVQCTFKKI